MKDFKDLGITTEAPTFTGDKIRMDRILNRQVVIHSYKIDNSKYEGKGKCLTMQISIDDRKHIVFTGSTVLMDTLQKIDKANFPFRTTIIKEHERFEFS